MFKLINVIIQLSKDKEIKMEFKGMYWLNPSNATWYHRKSGKRANSVKQWILRGKI